MPYIKSAKRAQFEELLPRVAARIQNVGEFNYVITRLLTMFIEDRKLNYACLNAVIGVLECAKLELYNRICAGYEELKLEENGDVYGDMPSQIDAMLKKYMSLSVGKEK